MQIAPATTPYVPLWCKSNYSFLIGASHPQELLEEAFRLGLRSMALTDLDGVYGVVAAHRHAQELGIQLIIGAEITLSDDSNLVLLATNRNGYANLCRLLSMGRLRSVKGSSCVEPEEVCAHSAGLILLWGGRRSALVAEQNPGRMAGALKEAFGERAYALLARHRQAGERREEARLRERARTYGFPLVASVEVLYHTQERRCLQDTLTCIRHGITLDEAGEELRPNAEHALRPPQAFYSLFEDSPEAIRCSLAIAEQCSFSLSELRYRYPVERLPGGQGASEWLRQLVLEGAAERYGARVSAEVHAQITRELELIHDLEYEGYFLTMHEIVQYCRAQQILCQGRGSAANSVVCYCLGITAIDPVRMGLLFERFISRERAEPPDIDLDIEHDRREEVIQHVYTRYGRTHAAMVANFVRYRARSAIRDVGKALALPNTAVERFARLVGHFEFPPPELFREAGFDPENPAHQNFLRLVKEIEDFPRHLSIHPGGFLLGHEPVDTLVPIENATMPGRTVIQWDKDDLEDLGLFKVDLLGLGALNVVHRAFDLISRHTGETWSLATIPPQDGPTFEMIQRADTVGTFQIESRAQMAMLPRLKPVNYYDLVVEVSLVRPGPITGGMVHPYLRRRCGEEPIDYPHPSLEPILKKTLGIPLFQEQVMQLAMVAADYTPGEADRLRRDMAAWRKTGRMERHRERLISRMVAKGIQKQFAERVFEQILGFGEYGFPESHAASFALIAYATAWLKCHYPAAFLCAMLNAQPMGFYSPSTLIGDATRHGIAVRPVDVFESGWECSLEPAPASGEGFAVRMGLRYVKGLRSEEAGRLVQAREHSPFASLQDFATRTALDNGALARLARSGALARFQNERRDALWDVLGVDRLDPGSLGLEESETETRFTPLNDLERIDWDYLYTSHSTQGHPLAPLREELARLGLPDAAQVRAIRNGRRIRYAGMVICRQRPGTANGVLFMTLEDEAGFVNVVIWQAVFEKFATIAKTASFLGVTGKMQVQNGVAHLVAEQLWIPALHTDPTATTSRDFH